MSTPEQQRAEEVVAKELAQSDAKNPAIRDEEGYCHYCHGTGEDKHAHEKWCPLGALVRREVVIQRVSTQEFAERLAEHIYAEPRLTQEWCVKMIRETLDEALKGGE